MPKKGKGKGKGKANDFDIEKYHYRTDTDNEWAIKSSFLIAHKSTIPEPRLVCLANTLKNVIIYGCKYPPEVMKELSGLAGDIMRDFEQKKKGVLQRYFVGASDATKQIWEDKKKRNIEKNEEIQAKKSKLRQYMTNFVKAGTTVDSEEGTAGASASQGEEDGSKERSDTDEDEGNNETEEPSDTVEAEEEGNTNAESPAQTESEEKPAKKKKKKRKKKKNKLNSEAEDATTPVDVNETEPEQASSDTEIGTKRKVQEETTSPAKKLKTSQGMEVPLTNTLLNQAKLQQGLFQQAWVPQQAKYSFAEFPQTTKQTPGPQKTQQKPMNCNGGSANDNANQRMPLMRDFVLFCSEGSRPFFQIEWACNSSRKLADYRLGDNESTLYIDGRQYASLKVEGRMSKKEMKDALAAKALEKLQEQYYTIEVKRHKPKDNFISREDVATNAHPDKTGKSKQIVVDPLDVSVPESSIGCKLLKLMGWSGGGLGKQGEGIAEPIKPIRVIGRNGLGEQKGLVNLKRYVNSIMQELINGTREEHVAFSPDFTKEERVLIHSCARGKPIKTRSYGKNDDRYMVISRKYNNMELLDKLLRDGEDENYSLKPPTNLGYGVNR